MFLHGVWWFVWLWLRYIRVLSHLGEWCDIYCSLVFSCSSFQRSVFLIPVVCLGGRSVRIVLSLAHVCTSHWRSRMQSWVYESLVIFYWWAPLLSWWTCPSDLTGFSSFVWVRLGRLLDVPCALCEVGGHLFEAVRFVLVQPERRLFLLEVVLFLWDVLLVLVTFFVVFVYVSCIPYSQADVFHDNLHIWRYRLWLSWDTHWLNVVPYT